MTFKEAENLVFEQLPVFSKVGRKAIKIGQDNIQKLCTYLDNPQNKFKSIHVAGTNGKGSTCHILSAIFTKAGYKTGLYTSPHLSNIRERCRINGKMVSEELFVQFVEKIQPILSDISPSYFELNVALAFYAFAAEEVDVAIIETGLGGRLDSTNIINPELSIITHIALDHTDILGDTLALIAAEKAGIIKEGKPAIIGKRQSETERIFSNKALSTKSTLYYTEDLLSIIKIKPADTMAYYKCVISAERKILDITTDLLGDFQAQNIATALSAIVLLQNSGWNVTLESAIEALQNVKGISGLKGRWDYWNEKIVLDVAHNPDGVRQIMENIESIPGQKYFLFGAAKDKDIETTVSLLPKQAVYLITQAQVPRAKPVEELEDIFTNAGLTYFSYRSVASAMNAYFENQMQENLLIIFGSFFIVGEAYTYLESRNNQ